MKKILLSGSNISFLITLLLFIIISSLSAITTQASMTSTKDTISDSRISGTDTRSATHIISITTTDTINNPIIQIRIPAATQTSASNDGIPDSGSTISTSGFDLGGITAEDVTCNGNGISWTASVTPSTATSDNYHVVTCTGAGTLNSSTNPIVIIGSTKKLINPAPLTSGYTKNSADIYNFVVRELDGLGNLVDSTTVRVAPIEGVLVSADIESTLTFTIAGVSKGENICNKNMSISTTSDTVPFSTIAPGNFYNAAQLLSVSTNTPNGYTLTTQENTPLSIDGLGKTFLPDTKCPTNLCSSTESADWTSSMLSGFGYSLANNSGSDTDFIYNESSRSFSARSFDSLSPRTIMKSSGPADNSSAHICYQIATSDSQTTGYYSNKLTFVALPNF